MHPEQSYGAFKEAPGAGGVGARGASSLRSPCPSRAKSTRLVDVGFFHGGMDSHL